MRTKWIALALLMLGLSFADFVIPSGQPICNLYGMIKSVGTVVGVIALAVAGFILASTHDISERNSAKSLIVGVTIGLIVIWLAPLVVTNLVGSGSVCGW